MDLTTDYGPLTTDFFHFQLLASVDHQLWTINHELSTIPFHLLCIQLMKVRESLNSFEIIK